MYTKFKIKLKRNAFGKKKKLPMYTTTSPNKNKILLVNLRSD